MIDMNKDIEFLDFMKDEIEVMSSIQERIVKDVEDYYTEICSLCRLSESLYIHDLEDRQKALSLLYNAKSAYKKIEEYRKKAIEPSRKVINSINDCMINLQRTLLMIEGIIDVKMMTWGEKKKSASK